ncbi:MAG: hypothetical protein LBR51_04480 [Bacteroidales bacterium]|jgi:hypothetical protein|nr:hypothetical protein [Bacteroidales bacterium]
MKKKYLYSLVVFVLLLAIVGATYYFFKKSPEDNSRKFDLPREELKPVEKQMVLRVHRYEQDLFALSLDSLSEGIERLAQVYPENLIAEAAWQNPDMIFQLRGYLQDSGIVEIVKKTMTVFPDLSPFLAEMKPALARYLYYFPDAEIPEIYTLVPGLVLDMPSVYMIDNNLFIHLDLYLGSQTKLYDKYGLPKYISERCDPKFLAIDCFKKALVYRHLSDSPAKTLLDAMIFEGKKLYFTEMNFPDRPRQDIIGYNENKYSWAEAHQFDVWNYLISKNELFSTGDKERQIYIEESPFTKRFSHESPGRIGTFIGWKIVQGFMKKHTEVSLQQLMQMEDARYILKESGYKPK